MLTREQMLQQVREDFPSKLNHFKKAYSGSLRAAHNAKCLECVWGDTRAIRECSAVACPLWSKRPYQNPEKTEAHCVTAEVKREAEAV